MKYKEKGTLLGGETITSKALHLAHVCEYPQLAKKFTTEKWLDMFKASFVGLRPFRKVGHFNKRRDSRYSRSKRRLLKKIRCQIVPIERP